MWDAIDSIQQRASDGSTTVEVTGVTAADKLTLEELRPTGQQPPGNTIPAGTDPATLPDGEYYDANGNHVIVSSDSNGNTHDRPAGEPEAGYYQRPDGSTNYAFNEPGQGGYVPPPPPPQDRTNWDDTSHRDQLNTEVAWFQDQLANPPADPTAAAAVLEELAATAEQNAAEWDKANLGQLTFTGADGQPIRLGDFYRAEATRYAKSATEIRDTLGATAAFASDVRMANAALTLNPNPPKG